MAATPHDAGVDNVISSRFAGEAAALAWLAGAGADVLVDNAPRNWLAASQPAAVAPAPLARLPAEAPRPFAAGASAQAAATATATATVAATAARAAETLAALASAVAGFAHPLRGTDAPELFSGAITSGIIIVADQPEPVGSDAARLRGRMLAAIGLAEGNCGILNLIPWPTLDNGTPRETQVADFAPFIARVLALATPKLLLALGERAASLAGPVRGIASARGQWRDVGGVPLLTTYHPRSLINQPGYKSLAWADLQAFAARISSRP